MTLIGMFDSGVGGLTVLREVASRLPHHEFVYFGDTGRCPYGPKSDATIIRYSIENSIFLLEQRVELIIVACHTAASLSLERLQNTFHVPIIGVVEPTIEKALSITSGGRIGVIGTRATIQSNIYQRKLKQKMKSCEITALACPLFVPIVEEDFPDEAVIRQVMKHYLEPIKKAAVDTLILGCTHYPLLQNYIREEMGEHVQLVNPATQVAEAAAQLVPQAVISSPKAHHFFVSDDPERFRAIGTRFFGTPLSNVHKASAHLG